MRSKRIRLAHKRFVLVPEVTIAREILIRKSAIFPHNQHVYSRLRPITGRKGIVQLHGEESKQARTKARTLFTGRSMQNFAEVLERRVENFVQDGKLTIPEKIQENVTHFVLATALEIFLGVREEKILSSLAEKFLSLNELCGQEMRQLFPLPTVIPSKRRSKIADLSAAIHQDLVQARKVFVSNQGNLSSLFSVFADDKHVFDHCKTFIFAGHETSAASIMFTLHLLSQNPKYQEQVASGDDSLIQAIYKESLRLYPPAYMLVRDASENCQIEHVSFKKGDNIIIPLMQMHQSHTYFHAANEFHPERFLPDSRFKDNLNAFMPFGLGAKSCIGERLAYLEATIFLRRVFREYRIEYNPNPISYSPLVTLHPAANRLLKFVRTAATQTREAI